MDEDQRAGQHEYEIDPARRLLILQLRGHTSLASLLSTARRIYDDPDYDPAFDAIVDSDGAEWDIDFNAIADYADRLRDDPRRLTGALALVTRDPVSFGIARMYDALGGEMQLEVGFEESMEAAIEWINGVRVRGQSKYSDPGDEK